MSAADEYRRVLLAPSTFNIVGPMRHIFGNEVGDALEVLLAQEAEHAARTLAADPGVRAAVEREARAPGIERLAVCDQDHGREGNEAAVYGHYASVRTLHPPPWDRHLGL